MQTQVRSVALSRKHAFTGLALLLSLIFFLTAGAVGVSANGPSNFTELAKKAAPSVVNISTERTVSGGGNVYRHFFGPEGGDPFFDEFFRQFGGGQEQERTERSLGSGFILDDSGYIVTNNHVIEGADKILVRLNDGREFDATVQGRDPNTDLALIKIDAGEKLATLPLGDSDAIEVGSWVLAVGSPFGLEQTVTAGIISAKGRVIGSGPFDNFLQTDASINPGNSGGPLIDMEGRVVGVNTAIVRGGQGIGFAIPINMARDVVEQLKASGAVSRGWIGITVQSVDKKLADYYDLGSAGGVLVAKVLPDYPAQKAGMQEGDIIVAVNGVKVKDQNQLVKEVSAVKPGQTAEVEILRDGKSQTLKIVTASRPDSIAAEGSPAATQENAMGARVSELTPELRQQYRLSDADKGLLVAAVENRSPAQKAGLQQGDLIMEINRTAVDASADLKVAWDKLKKGESLDMLIKKAGGLRTVVKIEKP